MVAHHGRGKKHQKVKAASVTEISNFACFQKQKKTHIGTVTF